MALRAAGRHYVIIMMEAYSARPATAVTCRHLGETGPGSGAVHWSVS